MEFEKLQMIIAEVLGKDSEQIYAKARLEWKTRLMLF